MGEELACNQMGGLWECLPSPLVEGETKVLHNLDTLECTASNEWNANVKVATFFWFVAECHLGTFRMRNTNISSLHFQVLDVDSPNYALFVQPNFTISFHIGCNIQINGKVITTRMNKSFCIHHILLQSCWIQKVTKYVLVRNTREWKNTLLKNFLLSVYRYVSNAEHFGWMKTYSSNFRWQNLDFHFRGYKSLLCTLGVGTW